ncbi:MAG: formylglycine-generating enzyme family protein [Anaerolineae bacterium]|nr:formylglycine-generating enzyme family protein [Anaerolineae bacterium]
MAANYHLANIRTLLTEGFSETELRNFCFDTPEFRPVYHELAELTGKAKIAGQLLEFADRRELIDLLLNWAQTNNPAKFANHQPYKIRDHLPRYTSSVISRPKADVSSQPNAASSSGAPLSPISSLPKRIAKALGLVPAFITKPIHLELVRVPAGKFLMGSDPQKDKNAREEEQPQHQVYVSEFYIGKYPITNEQYAVFVKAVKHRVPPFWENGKIPIAKENHPVVEVCWGDAVAFCKWLSRESGRTLRLPTEAEWEKAARGTDGRIYPWGNQWDSTKLNSGESGWNDTTPVDRYSPQGDSPYGAADMAGNVWEWCTDWYDDKEYYSRAKKILKDPEGAKRRVGLVVRGGAFMNAASFVRCAVRYGNAPAFWDNSYGFRVVLARPLLSESLKRLIEIA